MARFFVELDLEVNQELELPIEVVRHINVLRIRPTDLITLFNGDGYNYEVKFITLEKRQIICHVINKTLVSNESNTSIHLLMSIIANDKFDMIIQKSVELGVYEFTPLITQNTQRLSKEKLTNKIEHWQKIIISSSEQCGRTKLMQLNMPQEFNQIISQSFTGNKFLLSPHHAGTFNQHKESCSDITLMIGPEGGFTHDEVNVANQNGFNSILMGQRILRAETAAIAALGIIQYQFGDF